MNSKVVRNAIENYQFPKLLVWSSNDYMIGKNEALVALALNGATLSKDGKKVSIQVPIKYPRNSLVKLVRVLRCKRAFLDTSAKRLVSHWNNDLDP